MCERCIKFNVSVGKELMLRRANYETGHLRGQRGPDNKWRQGWKMDEQLLLNHRGEWNVLFIRCHDIHALFAITMQQFYEQAELIPNWQIPGSNEYYVYDKFFVRLPYPKELNPNASPFEKWFPNLLSLLVQGKVT